ncbi:YbjN domain-containing protein [Micromonospora sp. NBC_01796]|uniref:YbjN domain-containing protein n=1 Tax=Micromonospora sp. NBC_01796 TaxID=2975987 RepID=UPI002DD8A8AB|nr:YbjN domain-containing protein [Micromonospora sp. NBC_01796]WSA86967.1 YbjN domain-containing protein [Micromonospora sp. NBC_01796]
MSSPGFPHSSEEPAEAGQLQTLQPLTNDLIAAVLGARGFSFYTDGDGDLVGRWDDNLIYFFRLGPEGELLQVRTMAATTFPIDRVPELYAFCNSWNHDRLWPKAFVHVNDDGSARVCGEVTADLAQGVTLHQLDQLINCGISTGCQLAESAAELRP